MAEHKVDPAALCRDSAQWPASPHNANLWAGADEPLPLTVAPGIADAFDKDGVAATVHAIPRGQIGHANFLRRIMAAECARCEVFIDARKAMYFGRHGNLHTELFPRSETDPRVSSHAC